LARIEPKLSWIHRDDDSRKFIVEREIDQPSEGSPCHKDGVLGVMLAAYFSPQVRKSWPEHMGLRSSGFKQALGPAQIPVLTLFPHVQKRLLESELIKGAEELAS
jgi:hypothetical protein